MSLSRRRFAARLAAALGGLAVPSGLQGGEAAHALAALDRLVGLSGVGAGAPGGLHGRSPGEAGADEAGAGRTGVHGRLQEMFFQWEAVSDRVRVALGGGGNVMAVLGDRGALVSDAKNFGLGRTLRREVEASGRRVVRFVNTHHHGDHCGGNSAFMDTWKVAHRNAAPRIRATAAARLEDARAALGALAVGLREDDAPAAAVEDVEATLDAIGQITPDDFAPDRTHDGEMELALEGIPVELRWESRGHTDGDTFVFLPSENVLHCGDLFFHGRHPFVDDSAGATPAGWIRCVDAMLALCDGDTVVIPGHGAITDRDGLAGQRAYFERLREMVRTAVDEGRTREEVMALAPADLAAMTGAERHLARNLGIVYDEVAG